MRYHHLLGATRRQNRRLLSGFAAVAALAGGVYLLANAAAPSIGLFDSRPADSVARDLLNRPPVADQAKLYLPQLNIEMGLNPADIT
ncbi:MAG: hypothetical protein EOT04_03390, partial [Candidatus Chaera renei]